MQPLLTLTKCDTKRGFCLRLSAKDQGITRVVAVVVGGVLLVIFHLSHFLFKRNLREKHSSELRLKTGSFSTPIKRSTN